MSANRKWLLLPPAAALLLVLGSMAMQAPRSSGAATGPAAAEPGSDPQEPAKPPAARNTDARSTEPIGRREPPAAPRAPELWQVGSTLLGVLVLGGVAIMVARRLRRGPAPTAHDAARLRQVLRLSAKQSLFVVEFDEQVFLIGEGERGLTALHRAGAAAAAEDEDQVERRDLRADGSEDEGAVPKNLVIPRPDAPPARRAPTAPATRPAANRNPALTDFRALLQKAGKA